MPHQSLTDDTFFLNLGPQHPSTHGVLRMLLKLDGEYVVEAEPVIGYSHRGQEHMAQNRAYAQFLPNVSRMDYLAGLMFNHAYCLAVEKAAGIKVPERGECIRTICAEFNRISSHLLWFGTYLLDIGGITPFLYAFDDREQILDLLNEITGSRLTYSYCRFGGVRDDITERFPEMAKAFIARLRARLKDYDTLVTKNIIFEKRTKGIGIIKAEDARRYGLTGPCLRASGVAYDVRRAEPYGMYPEFQFDIPTGATGDCFDRYMIRLQEMEQSMRIIEQALGRLAKGPFRAEVPLWVEPPAGDYHFSYETARGHLGIYIVSDGGRVPFRMKWRTPSFCNLSIMPMALAETLVADTIAILGSIDVVMPEVDR